MLNKKLIAKNTVLLYVRTFITTLVGLYTSRVVLRTLGVEDYGIYGVVGGIVPMFSFLNSAMAGATSRFMSYEMGRIESGESEKDKRLRDTFSSALIVHLLIAGVVILLAETVGLWFLHNKLVIPENRMWAANWVYQFSVISAAIEITQVPYNSVIFAHEKLGLYAYVEMLGVLLKLGIVFLLVIGNFDKLILYSFLTLIIAIVIRLIYRLYCLKHYPESHFRFVYDKSILKPMLSFSGWNMYTQLSTVFKAQGVNFVINFFYGVALNAASSVATTVEGTIKGLSHIVTTAMTPQIVKNYSIGKYDDMSSLMLFSIKITGIMMGMFSVPLIICCDSVMKIWLVDVPEYAVLFCRILLCSGVFAMINSAVYNGIYAAGKMKNVSFVTGSLSILIVFILYLLYQLGCPPKTAQELNLILNVIVLLINLVFLKKEVPQIELRKFAMTIMMTLLIIGLSGIPSYYVSLLFSGNWTKTILVTLTSSIVMLALSYSVLLNKSQRIMLVNLIRSKISQ